MCVVVYYYSDIKICGEGGAAGGRAADQRGAGAAAAARHLGLQRADSKICSTDWNRLRVCRSALVETWPMLGLSYLLIRNQAREAVFSFASKLSVAQVLDSGILWRSMKLSKSAALKVPDWD